MKKILFFALFSLVVPISSFAATEIKNTLQVAPLKYEEKMNLGDVKEGTIDVINPTTKDEKIAVEVSSMKMTGVDGQLVFYNDDKANSFEKFVTLSEKSFILPAGEGRKYKFRIGIPISASSGGYFGAIFFRLVPEESDATGSRAIATGQVGTLFLLNVGQGEVRTGKLDSFKVIGNPFSAKTDLEVTQSNLAKYNQSPQGTYLKPTGTIMVKNIFGKVISKQNIEGYYVLPETKRVIKKELNNPYLFGLYKAELTIANYPGDPVVTKTTHFFKFSSTILAIIGLLALIIFITITFIRPRLKKRKNK
jgi:hypothetical protein